jgi:DNA polymerase-4
MAHLKRRIVCIWIPHLFSEGETRRNKALRGIPLVIVSGSPARSVVIDCSREIEGSCVKKGAFLKDIAALREKVRALPADYEYIEGLHKNLLGYLNRYSPSVESTGPGEYYLDLTGTRKLFGREIDTCGKIMQELKTAFGFTSRMGIGSTLLVSRLASRTAGFGGVYDVSRSAERTFLSPLSVDLLTGLSPEVRDELLHSYNIRSLGDLLLFSLDELTSMFGKDGALLYGCSRGFSRNTVVREKAEKVLKTELVVSSDSNDDGILTRSLFSMVLDLCTRMRRERLFPRTFCLRVVYQDSYRVTAAGKLNTPSFFEKTLYGELEAHMNRALRRRTCVKKIVLSFSNFITPSFQLSLFTDSASTERLADAFDMIQNRFGKKYIGYGA